ncbi:MAG: cytochrome P450 [Anaerolineales bacterium]|nr:cytochrome P450 [Anaerolineales bacterium]
MTKSIEQIPAPAPMPLFGWRGTLWQLFSDPLNYLQKLRQQHGDVFAFVRGGNPPIFFPANGRPHTLMAFGAEFNRQLLSNSDVFYSGPLLGPMHPMGEVNARRSVLKRLGTGLFGVNGIEHRRQRRLVMPAFHKQKLGEYYQDMIRIIQWNLDSWKLNEQRDIWNDMMNITLQVAAQCLFGLDIRREGQAFGDLIQEWLHHATSPQTVSLQIDLPGFPYHRFLNLSHKLDTTIRELIQQRRNAEGQDVLSLLLNSRDENGNPAFTDDEIIGHSVIFIIAGHETSSNALAWTFFLLSQHPQVMKNLRLELDEKLGSQTPAYDSLKQLTYLDNIVKESMRILPPVPMSARVVASPIELGGYLLPIGTEIGFSHFHTHHDSSIYQDPETFNPSRWQHINPSAHEYMPFSAGIRACIGMPFALMEIPLILALTLQRYRLELVPNSKIDLNVGITISPKHGLSMFIRPADGNYEAGAGNVKGTIRNVVNL